MLEPPARALATTLLHLKRVHGHLLLAKGRLQAQERKQAKSLPVVLHASMRESAESHTAAKTSGREGWGCGEERADQVMTGNSTQLCFGEKRHAGLLGSCFSIETAQEVPSYPGICEQVLRKTCPPLLAPGQQ